MKTDAPQYYVITAQGQSGPYDIVRLREALRAGEVHPEDRVRTALGTPLGSVVKVLDLKGRSSRLSGLGRPHNRGRWLRGWVPIVVAIGLILGLALMLGSGRGTGPTAVPAVPEPAVRLVAPVAQSSRTVPEPAVRPVVPVAQSSRTVSEPAPATAPVLPRQQSAAPAVAPVQDVVPAGAGLLAGRLSGDWLIGGGGRVMAGSGGSWQLDFPAANGCWVGIGPASGTWSIRDSSALVLAMGGGSATGQIKLQVIEGDGEAFCAMIRLPAEGVVTIPWSGFARDTVQRKGAPSDGFQGAEVRFVALIGTGEPVHVLLRDLRFAKVGGTPAASNTAPPPATVVVQASVMGSLASLLGRHAATDWASGGAAVIQAAPDRQSWIIDLPEGGGGWVGIAPIGGGDAMAGSAGVRVDVTGGSADCRLLLQLIEPDGESFVSSFPLSAGTAASGLMLPWSSFRRDRNQRPGAPDNGFQQAGVTYLSLSLLSGGAKGIILRGLSLYP